ARGVAGGEDADRHAPGSGDAGGDVPDEADVVVAGHPPGDDLVAGLRDGLLDLQALLLEEALLDAEVHGGGVGDGQRADPDGRRLALATATPPPPAPPA